MATCVYSGGEKSIQRDANWFLTPLPSRMVGARSCWSVEIAPGPAGGRTIPDAFIEKGRAGAGESG